MPENYPLSTSWWFWLSLSFSLLISPNTLSLKMVPNLYLFFLIFWFILTFLFFFPIYFSLPLYLKMVPEFNSFSIHLLSLLIDFDFLLLYSYFHFLCKWCNNYVLFQSIYSILWLIFLLSLYFYFPNYFDMSRQKRVLFYCFATKQCLGMLKMWG